VLPDDVVIRPMQAGEAPDVYELCLRVLFEDDPNVTAEVQRRRSLVRIDHPRATDPGGAWVAEHDGVVAGVAMAIVRERVWGFSLFAVDEHLQGRGVGRELLECSLAYGEQRGAEGWIILSSEKPAAMRRYGHAGFDLHPTLAAMGVPDLRRAPDGVDAVEDAGPAGLPLADAIGRELRGAGYADDLAVYLGTGARLLAFEDRAVACVREGQVQLLLARDELAASLVLWSALTTSPPGSTALVLFISAAQQWAIRVALDARLPLSADGPLCVRGRLGPLAPFLPSGAWL
jgi:GNAT superfamily N-acetyltransferase